MSVILKVSCYTIKYECSFRTMSINIDLQAIAPGTRMPINDLTSLIELPFLWHWSFSAADGFTRAIAE